MTDHHYAATIAWSGSTGDGYAGYRRDHDVQWGDEILTLSADPAFRGDGALPNPEELLLAAAASCQLLSFLAVAALAKVDVVGYVDDARAVMPAGSSPVRITRVELSPRITVRGADAAAVVALAHEAHDGCYIANSLSAEVVVAPIVEVVP